jgi:hypothetical protein
VVGTSYFSYSSCGVINEMDCPPEGAPRRDQESTYTPKIACAVREPLRQFLRAPEIDIAWIPEKGFVSSVACEYDLDRALCSVRQLQYPECGRAGKWLGIGIAEAIQFPRHIAPVIDHEMVQVKVLCNLRGCQRLVLGTSADAYRKDRDVSAQFLCSPAT